MAGGAELQGGKAAGNSDSRRHCCLSSGGYCFAGLSSTESMLAPVIPPTAGLSDPPAEHVGPTGCRISGKAWTSPSLQFPAVKRGMGNNSFSPACAAVPRGKAYTSASSALARCPLVSYAIGVFTTRVNTSKGFPLPLTLRHSSLPGSHVCAFPDYGPGRRQL